MQAFRFGLASFLAALALIQPLPAGSLATVKRLRTEHWKEDQAVTVRGVVTSLSGWKNSFFLQDETGGISIDRLDQNPIHTGDEVVVEGKLRAGLFAPLILRSSVAVIRNGAPLPRPQTPPYEQMLKGRFDSSWIEVRGVVHSAKIESVWDREVLLLSLYLPEGSISVHIQDYTGIPVDSLVDSTVTVRGVCGSKFNGRKQIIGLRLFVPGRPYLKIEEPAPDPAQIEKSEISQAQQYSSAEGSLHRVRMDGTLTYQSAEHGLYLTEKDAAIHLQTSQPGAFRLGDRLEALGFLHNFGFSPGLQDAQVRRLGVASEVKPVSVDAANVITIKDGFRTTLYDGRLVRMTATVLEQIPNSENQVWLLRRGNVVFQAELSSLGSSGQASFEARSTVDITGVCVAEVDENGSPTSFRILLRAPHDITVAESPYSKGALLILLAGLLFFLVGGLLLWQFERRYGSERSPAVGAARLKQLLARFQESATVLSLLVFPLVLSFAVLPQAFTRQADLASSVPNRLALAMAALAVLWNHSQTAWKNRSAVFCSLLIAIAGCTAFRQGATTPIAIAFCFCLLGLGLLVLPNRRLSALAQLLFIAVAAVSLLNVVALLYGAPASYGVARHTAMPPAVAVCLCCLSVAALFSSPDSGLMKAVSSQRIGGRISRRLLPTALLIPVCFGWVRLQGQLLGLYDTLFGLALFAMSNVLSFGCIIWVNSAVLNRLDLARSKGEEALRERDQRPELLFEKSGIGDYIWDIQNDEVRFHPIVRQLYGVAESQETSSADWFRNRQHPADAAMIAQEVQAAIANKTPLDIEFRLVLPEGKIRWISCRGNVVYDEAGKATHIHGLNIDVTARKQSEAVVRESLEAVHEADLRLQTGLEFAKVAVWTWTSSPDTVKWSGPVEQIFGRSAVDVSTFAQFREFMHPEDLPELEAKVARSMKSGGDYRAQFRILAPGGIRWIAGRGGVLRDGSGHVYGMSGVNFDITATKIAEQRLSESERSFRQLADAMPQIVWGSNANGDAEYCNRRWYAYTGSSTVQEISQFVEPGDWEKARREWRKAMESQSPFSCELRLKRASDDSYRWHLSRALPIRGEDGRIAQWYGTSTDIDDYKKAQAEVQSLNSNLERLVEERSAELAESELRYRLLVQGVKDYAIFLLDARGLVKSWNRGAEQLMGYQSLAIVGQHFSTFYNPADVKAGVPQESLRAAAAEGRSYQEGWRIRQDGGEFWAGVVTTPLLDSDDQLRGYSKIIRDMTEQRRVESLLIAERKRAENANQAKSAFLASMSHEIRTPMNAILGMADMLWESDLSHSQRHYVEIFRRAGGSLLTLINDILDLSKIESGHFCLEEVDFDLTALVEQVIEILTPKAESKDLSLRAHLAFAAAPNLVGDPVRLQQILLNLLGNAIKFTDKGEVLLRVRCQTAESYATLEFDVSDTGIGIPSHKLETIFEDFEQAETSTTRRFGGTGLGLGISRRLVRRMRGEIHASSEMGKGSTFSFHVILPIGAERNTSVSGELEDIAGRRVLIVDNNATNRIILSEMCSAWGMAVTNCASGAEAVELAGREFDLALVDRMMPGMDGFETADRLQRGDPKTAIFIVSSDSQAGDISRCREMGLAGHLMKPVRRAELLEQIVRALGRTPELAAIAAISPPPANPLEPGRRFRILTAEDSEDNQFLLQAYCQGSPYDLTFVEDGELAVAAYRGNSFDLILMDVQMPIMDGLTAAREIRAIESAAGAKRIPILALTANALPEDVGRAREAGCDAHLAKPISKKSFLSGLAQWLAKSPVEDPAAARIDIPEGLEELAPKYLAARRRELALFRDLLEQSDFEKLRRLSHNLKGTGASYGFPDISRLGSAIEQASKDCNLPSLSRQIAELSAFIGAASANLKIDA